MVQLASGSIIASKYRLERRLARGGMGVVWAARHLRLDSDVAIKFMAPEVAASHEVRLRFESEAKACAKIRVPNVVQVHDYGIEDDTPYLVMELLHGEDLEARLRREGRITPAAMVSIVDQVCKGLHGAHEVGLVHRDLKPANLFLARQSEEQLVKILDFGIAKSTGAGLVGRATKTGMLVGSPHYMSPEQVRRSQEIDPRSDLWALSVIIFQCLTGRLPFPSPEVGDVFVDICTKDIPPASQIAPDLGPEVDQFLARAFMREPKERFQTARAFADAFSAMVARAANPSAGSTLVSMGRTLGWPPHRGSRPRILLVAVALVLTLGLGVAAVIAFRSPVRSAPEATPVAVAAPPSIEAPESAPPAPIPSAPLASAAPSASPAPTALSAPTATGPDLTAPPRGTVRRGGKPATPPPLKRAPAAAPSKDPPRKPDPIFGY